MLFVVWEFMHVYEINFSGQRMRRYLTRMDLALYKDSATKKMGATRRTWHFLNLNVAAFNLLAAYFRAELPGYGPELLVGAQGGKKVRHGVNIDAIG